MSEHIKKCIKYIQLMRTANNTKNYETNIKILSVLLDKLMKCNVKITDHIKEINSEYKKKNHEVDVINMLSGTYVNDALSIDCINSSFFKCNDLLKTLYKKICDTKTTDKPLLDTTLSIKKIISFITGDTTNKQLNVIFDNSVFDSLENELDQLRAMIEKYK